MLADQIREDGIDELADRMTVLNARMTELKDRLTREMAPFQMEMEIIQDELHNRYGTLVEYEAAKKAEPSGKVVCNLNRHRLVAHIHKKVTWNQDDLIDLSRVLSRDEFMGLFGNLKISETAYKKAMRTDYDMAVMGARTVEYSSPTYTLETDDAGSDDEGYQDPLEGTVGSYPKPTSDPFSAMRTGGFSR